MESGVYTKRAERAMRRKSLLDSLVPWKAAVQEMSIRTGLSAAAIHKRWERCRIWMPRTVLNRRVILVQQEEIDRVVDYINDAERDS